MAFGLPAGGGLGHRALRVPSGATSKAKRDQLAMAVRSFGRLPFRTHVVLCGYQRQPMELDVALVVNGVSDRRECAQHRLPELKACGMLLQSIFARHGPHSD